MKTTFLQNLLGWLIECQPCPILLYQPALLYKSVEGRTPPFPGQTYPASSVMGVPSAVKLFRTATLTWNSAT